MQCTMECTLKCTINTLRSGLLLHQAWVPLPIPTFYNPVGSLLVPRGDSWLRMRTTGEVRRYTHYGCTGYG